MTVVMEEELSLGIMKEGVERDAESGGEVIGSNVQMRIDRVLGDKGGGFE